MYNILILYDGDDPPAEHPLKPPPRAIKAPESTEYLTYSLILIFLLPFGAVFTRPRSPASYRRGKPCRGARACDVYTCAAAERTSSSSRGNDRRDSISLLR